MEITVLHLVGFIAYIICWSLFILQRSGSFKHDIPIFDCGPLWVWWIVMHVVFIIGIIVNSIPWFKVIFKI